MSSVEHTHHMLPSKAALEVWQETACMCFGLVLATFWVDEWVAGWVESGTVHCRAAVVGLQGPGCTEHSAICLQFFTVGIRAGTARVVSLWALLCVCTQVPVEHQQISRAEHPSTVSASALMSTFTCVGVSMKPQMLVKLFPRQFFDKGAELQYTPCNTLVAAGLVCTIHAAASGMCTTFQASSLINPEDKSMQ